jgi:thioredoxin reductase (NADPH)
MTTSTPQYDVLIIGGACAGLAAATYAARRALKVLVITKDIGGQIATTPSVENYPGIDSITGPDLAQNFYMQALQWGAEVTFDEVATVTKHAEHSFEVVGNQETYTGKSLILAYGKTPRSLNVEGEKLYAGKGVSYCVTCDAPLFRDKTVAVVGGGSSAMEGALILAKTSKKVYLVHRRDTFRGEAVLLEQIKKADNIELVLSYAPEEVTGDGKFVRGLTLSATNGGEARSLEVDGIFVEIGFMVNSGLVKHLVTVDAINQIITNKRMETSTSGVFAAGDITDSPYKQAVISAGEGATAALTAYSYLNEGKPAGVDWSTHPTS